MSAKVIQYNRDLNTLIASFKPQITVLMDNYETPIGSFITAISNLIKSINSKSEDGLYNNLFLIKSYLCLLLHFYNYESIDNGKLLGNSSNCKFTIANVTSNNGGIPYKLFIKVIDYSSQYISSRTDLSIYDILTSIIFNKIFLIEEYKKFKDFIPEYKGSCLSYIKKDATGTYWDFNDIKKINEKELTYYNGETLEKNLNPFYNSPVILVMFEAINHPISVSDVFKFFSTNKTQQSIDLVVGVLANAYDVYNFLETVGSEYGFMHNDLHFSNIIYDQNKNKLVIIDFGRCVFAKFRDEVDTDINNKLLTEFKKLNYNVCLNRLYLTDSIITNKAERLYKRDVFKYHISIIGNDRTRKYFGVIYDLITYSLNMYIRILYFLRETDTVNADTVEYHFSLLIKANYNYIDDLVNQRVRLEVPTNTIRELMDNYLEAKTDFIDGTQDEDTKKFFTMLLNGLFYTALLLHYTGKNYKLIYDFFQVKSVSLTGFFEYIQKEIFSKKEYLEILKNDNFLMQFVVKQTSSRKGGLSALPITENPKVKNSMTKLKSLFSKKSPIISKTASLQETTDAYEKIFNDKDIFDLKLPIEEKKQTKSMRKFKSY